MSPAAWQPAAKPMLRGGFFRFAAQTERKAKRRGTRFARQFVSSVISQKRQFFIARLLQSAQNFCIIRNDKHADGESTRRICFSGRPAAAASERDTARLQVSGDASAPKFTPEWPR